MSDKYDWDKDDKAILKKIQEGEIDAAEWDETDTITEDDWDDAENALPRCDACHMETSPREMAGALCFECLAVIEEEGLTEY